MRALDTNVLLRFLLDDDKAQARRVRTVLAEAEASGERYLVTSLVVLEMLWVLSAVYDLGREDVVHALGLLTQMPVLEFEHRDAVLDLVREGPKPGPDLSDLLIGLVGRESGAEATLSFDRALWRTGLFEKL